MSAIKFDGPISLIKQSPPATSPAAGRVDFYVGTDGRFYERRSDGVDRVVGEPPQFPMRRAVDRIMAMARHANIDGVAGRSAIMFIGDSITEQFGATSPGQGWIDKLVRRLQLSVGGGPHIGYIPTGAGYSPWPGYGTTGGPWTRTPGGGTIVDYTEMGMGYRSVYFTCNAQPYPKISYSFRGTAVQVFYTRTAQATPNSIVVRIDGTVVATLNGNNATTILGASSAVLEAPTGFGWHTLEIEYAAIGGVQVVDGVLFLDYNKTGTDVLASSGIVPIYAGHSGYSATHFGDVDSNYLAPITNGTIVPRLVVIALGANDRTATVPVASFAASLDAAIDRIDAACTAGGATAHEMPSYILWPYWAKVSETNPVPWLDYVKKYYEVAALDPARRFVANFHDLIPTGMPDTALAADGTHPTPLGMEMIAQFFNQLLDPTPARVKMPGIIGNGKGVTLDVIETQPDQRKDWPQFYVAGSTNLSGSVLTGVKDIWYDLPPNTGVTSGTPLPEHVGEVRFRVWLDKGVYTSRLSVYLGSNTGIGEIYINGTLIGSLDTYRAATSSQGMFGWLPATTYTVTEPGWHVLTIRKTGTKNPSSTAYYFLVERWRLMRTVV